VHPATNGDLLTSPLDGRRRSTPFVALPGWDLDAVFSPDGKWVACASDVSGKSEIYVGPYPPGAQPERLSSNGGTGPQWARNLGPRTLRRTEHRRNEGGGAGFMAGRIFGHAAIPSRPTEVPGYPPGNRGRT